MTAMRNHSYSSFDDQERSFAQDARGPSAGMRVATGFFGRAGALPTGGSFCDRVAQGARNFLNGNSVAGKVFDVAIMALIVLNVCCMIVYPDERGTILAGHRAGTAAWGTADQRKRVFDTIESVSVGIFTAEWLVRLLVATEDRGPRKAVFRGKEMCFVPVVLRTQLLARLRYAVSFFSIVDLATIVPYYVDLALTSIDLPSVQFIRVARLLRIFREGSWIMGSTATAVRRKLFDQMRKTKTVWYTAMFLGLVIWVVCSSLCVAARRCALAAVFGWSTGVRCASARSNRFVPSPPVSPPSLSLFLSFSLSLSLSLSACAPPPGTTSPSATTRR